MIVSLHERNRRWNTVSVPWRFLMSLLLRPISRRALRLTLLDLNTELV